MTGDSTDDLEWTKIQVIDNAGKPIDLLLLPDTFNTTKADTKNYYYLPLRPSVVYDFHGYPVISLYMVLNRYPTPDEDNINLLLQQGTFTFDFTFDLSKEQKDVLEKETKYMCKPIFFNKAAFNLLRKLENEGEKSLATVITCGSNIMTSFSLYLNRDELLEVLSAMEGNPSSIYMNIELDFVLNLPNQKIRMYGSWESIYDFLGLKTSTSDKIELDELKSYFDEMLKSDIIKIFNEHDGPIKETFDFPLFDIFLRVSSIILVKDSTNDSNGLKNVFYLRKKPSSMFYLDYRQEISAQKKIHKSIDVSMDKIIGEILKNFDKSLFIKLRAPPNAIGFGFELPPKRIKIFREDQAQYYDVPNMKSSNEISLIFKPSRLESLDLTLLPKANGNLKPLFILPLSKPSIQGTGLFRFRPIKPTIGPHVLFRPHFPIVDDINSPIWKDAGGKGFEKPADYFWYKPDLDVINPENVDTPSSSSSFLFTFQRSDGFTTDGKQSLTGTITFIFKKTMSEKTKTVMNGMSPVPLVYPIPTDNLAISLGIPFVDINDGVTKEQMFSSSIETIDNETIKATIKMNNVWVNLSYGSFAKPNFQVNKAKLYINYTFQAWVPVSMKTLRLVSGEKQAITPVIFSPEDEINGESFYDASNNIYHFHSGEIKMYTEREHLFPSESENTSNHINNKRSSNPSHGSTFKSIIINRPLIKIRPVVLDNNAIQTLSCSIILDKIYPCDAYGKLYRELISDNSVAVGCIENAFDLGQKASYKQYEEIAELTDSSYYQVYQSIQQHNRFLVLPKYYRITRYASSEKERAYKPILYVFSLLDPDPKNNHFVYNTCLQPDIPQFMIRNLFNKLLSYDENPVIEYPTELINLKSEYTWIIPQDSNIQIDVVAGISQQNTIQVALTTNLVGALVVKNMLEQSGIYGKITFTLPDGSLFNSNLNLELIHITGPSDTGPIEVMMSGNNVQFTNKIERQIAVSSYVIYHNKDDKGQIIDVSKPLAPNTSLSESLILTDNLVTEIYPVYTIINNGIITIEEIRSFVENVYTNIIFLDGIDYASHALKEVNIRVRIKDIEGEYPVSFVVNQDTTKPRIGEVNFTLPITAFTDKTILQFKAIKHFLTNEVIETPWIEWNLDHDGIIINLDWHMIE